MKDEKTNEKPTPNPKSFSPFTLHPSLFPAAKPPQVLGDVHVGQDGRGVAVDEADKSRMEAGERMEPSVAVRRQDEGDA